MCPVSICGVRSMQCWWEPGSVKEAVCAGICAGGSQGLSGRLLFMA